MTEMTTKTTHIIIDRDTLAAVADKAEQDKVTTRYAHALREACEVTGDAVVAEGARRGTAITYEVDTQTSGRHDDASEIPEILDAVLIGQVDALRTAIGL